jgi:hypothetical protein
MIQETPKSWEEEITNQYSRRDLNELLNTVENILHQEKTKLLREVLAFIPDSYENAPMYSELESHIHTLAKKEGINLEEPI